MRGSDIKQLLYATHRQSSAYAVGMVRVSGGLLPSIGDVLG